MRKLVLLRHAEAEAAHGGRDFDRELTASGQRDAALMGVWMAAQGLAPDHVVSSPAPRALETAHLVCSKLGIRPDRVRLDQGLYDCAPTTFLNRLGRLPAQAACILLVGHNPSLEEVARHLTGDEDLAVRGLATAGVVVADLPDDWRDLGARSAKHWRVADPSTSAR